MDLRVYYNSYGQRVPLGVLSDRDETYIFEYDAGFEYREIDVCPLFPSADVRKIKGTKNMLPCLFWDFLPSGYNAEVLHKLSSTSIPLLKQLAMHGRRGVGALEFEPELAYSYEKIPVDLDMAESDIRFENNLSRQFRLSAGIAGHTPKISVKVSKDKQQIYEDTDDEGFADWIIKLPSSRNNPLDGVAEFVYNKMAKKAGIAVPQFYLFNARASAGYFGSKRFDYQNGIKRHVLSIGSLMNKNYLFERIYLGYYTDIVRKIAPEEIEKLLRLLMFDLKTGNEDIRGGGISMILTEENKWVLAPAYDLVPFSLENDYTPKMLKKDYEKDAVDALIYDLCEAAEFNFDTAAKMIEQVEDAVAEYSRLSLEFK